MISDDCGWSHKAQSIRFAGLLVAMLSSEASSLEKGRRAEQTLKNSTRQIYSEVGFTLPRAPRTSSKIQLVASTALNIVVALSMCGALSKERLQAFRRLQV